MIPVEILWVLLFVNPVVLIFIALGLFKREKIDISSRIIFMMLLVLPTLLGTLLYYQITETARRSWYRLIFPSGETATALAFDHVNWKEAFGVPAPRWEVYAPTLFVQTKLGNVYACVIQSRQEPLDCKRIAIGQWPMVKVPSDSSGLSPWVKWPSTMPDPPDPLGKVIDSVAFCVSYTEAIRCQKIVVLDDGNIWGWDYLGGGFVPTHVINALVGAYMGCTGGLLVLVGGLIIWGIRHKSTK